MAIKRGEVSLADVKARADELWEMFYRIKKDADLPPQPDYDTINELLVSVIHDANTPATEPWPGARTDLPG